MARLNKITPDVYPSLTCNTCGKAPETQDHIFKYAHSESRKHQIKVLKTMEQEGKEFSIKTFLIRTLAKGIHACIHDLPLPAISPKRHPVHQMVREAYTKQNLLWSQHAIQGYLSTKICQGPVPPLADARR